MIFPEVGYIRWAKATPNAATNLARSGVEQCPASMLGMKASELAANVPVHNDGWAPLVDRIARRYNVSSSNVYTVSGGASFANFLACAAVLNGAGRSAEVLVERPTYEPLLRIPQALGARTRRFDRLFAEGYSIDLDRFAAVVTPRTRLAVVSNLHNPSGARVDQATLSLMAAILDRVGGVLMVDEVYMECLFGSRPRSSVHAGENVVSTNSLTKAYGLDGLRAGWILGPPAVIERAAVINDLMTNHGVAPGEVMSRAAFRRLPSLQRRSRALLDPNLKSLRRFFEQETRLRTVMPEGGTVVFPRLPQGLQSDRFADHLLRRYSTLVVPGRFFESPQHVRISFGLRPAVVARGLRAISRTLDDLGYEHV